MGMVKKAAMCSALGAALFLTGCLTKSRYEAGQEALKGSPALKADLIAKCVKDNRSTDDEKKMLRNYMNLAPGQDVIGVLCVRVINGIAAGRISNDDFLTASNGNPNVRFLTVLKGR